MCQNFYSENSIENSIGSSVFEGRVIRVDLLEFLLLYRFIFQERYLHPSSFVVNVIFPCYQSPQFKEELGV